MIYVILANTNSCRIYNYENNYSKLRLLREIQHPEIRHKASEGLTSDKPGHYQTSESAGGAYSPHTDPKEAAMEAFAREMADELDKDRKNNAYEKLILIAAPHIYGLLNQSLSKNVKRLVISKIEKDITHFNNHELEDFLKKHATYPNK